CPRMTTSLPRPAGRGQALQKNMTIKVINLIWSKQLKFFCLRFGLRDRSYGNGSTAKNGSTRGYDALLRERCRPRPLERRLCAPHRCHAVSRQEAVARRRDRDAVAGNPVGPEPARQAACLCPYTLLRQSLPVLRLLSQRLCAADGRRLRQARHRGD